MKKILNYILGLYLLFGAVSCEEKYLDIEPLGNPTDVTFFANESQLQLAINAIYGRSEAVMLEGTPLTLVMDQWLTDNGLYRITDELAGLRALSNSQHDPSSGFGTIYSNYYRSIARTNNMLGNMDRARETMSEDKFNDFKAQALAMRAFFYHGLVQFFGDVPYLDFNPTTPTAGFVERTSKEEIITNILADLDEAASLINPDLQGMQERMTLTTIYALKGRVALFAKRYDVAIDATDDALVAAANQGIGLHDNYGELFSIAGEKSSEILMRQPFNEEWKKGNSFNLRMGYRYGMYSQTAPTQNLIDAYPTINGLPIDQDPAYDPTMPWENRDPRLRASVVIPGDVWGGILYKSHRDSLTTIDYRTGTASEIKNNNCRSASWPACLTGYLWRKYVDEEVMQTGGQTTYIDFILLRLAEVYLIKAEAEIESNGDLQAAADALNMLRERAYGPGYPMISVSDQTGMRKILRIERRIELANEGHRYTDGLRWGILENIRGEALIGRPMDVISHTFIPSIDNDGVTHYSDRSQYDDWRSLLVNGAVDPTGYDARLYGNWQNAHERGFTAPRDYLLPIPQEEIDLYEANGFVLTQNDGY
ncbi:MAG: RagB/SusD family nutrient uptake outer membrane protein [Carboxylicivirga sp.]|nr:RagB/SusD family nutrient uptake outer membrane protein [Carboxylicivirga sp.]MCT4646690.1 RagB/SusD family nutrient uptake outer membrane protein [Carboxylicivirga sp.]